MKTGVIRCGVKFCGGCNPKYDRGKAFTRFKAKFENRICFDIAQEGIAYDLLLIIGGCGSCCASYDQYNTLGSILKVWDQTHIEDQLKAMEEIAEIITESSFNGEMEDLYCGLEKTL